MVKKTYQLQEIPKKTAKAIHANANVSLKYSVEIVREIKGKNLEKAKKFLQEIIAQKEFLPLRKYNKKVAHRKGQSKSKTKSGRYPKKTCQKWIELLDTVKANAANLGMDEENLKIIHAFASKGYQRITMQPKGRIAGKRRKRKSAHIEVIVQEVE